MATSQPKDLSCESEESASENALADIDVRDENLNVDPLWRIFLKAMAFYRARENGWDDFPSLRGLPADDETLFVYAQGRMPLASGSRLAALESTFIVDDSDLLTQMLGAFPAASGLRPTLVLNVHNLHMTNRSVHARLNLGEVKYSDGKVSIKWYATYCVVQIVAGRAPEQLQFKLVSQSVR